MMFLLNFDLNEYILNFPQLALITEKRLVFDFYFCKFNLLIRSIYSLIFFNESLSFVKSAISYNDFNALIRLGLFLLVTKRFDSYHFFDNDYLMH